MPESNTEKTSSNTEKTSVIYIDGDDEGDSDDCKI